MRIITALSVALFLSSLSAAFGAVDISYEELALQEIAYRRTLKIEEKKIEVLARLERMSAPQTTVNSYSNNSLHSYSRNNSSSTQTTEVSR